MWEIHKDLIPDTKLLFNGLPTNSTPEPDDPDAKFWPAYRDLVFDEIKPPNFDMKQGVVSHQYMTSCELDDYMVQGNITRFPYRNAATGVVEFVRTRGESSDGGLSGDGQGAGFWRNVRSPRPSPPVAAVSCANRVVHVVAAHLESARDDVLGYHVRARRARPEPSNLE